jgi:opacity protein-like surface antigen
MRRLLACVSFVAVAAAAAPASAGNLDIRFGQFIPRADTGAFNDLLQDDIALYNVRKRDFTGFSGGVQYNMELAPHVELGLSADVFDRHVDTSYRDYVDDGGGEIRQTIKYQIAPLGVSLRLVPGRRHLPVAPYVGAGADLLFWRYEEYGDFIDFSSSGLPIVRDSFVSDGVRPGFHVMGGLRIALNEDFGLTGEARYQWATADMDRDFAGNKIDLTGLTWTVGLNIRF